MGASAANPSDHALSRRRPFCRRDRTTARPARVDIRCRNPCLRARFRLFGWNVRFIDCLLGIRPARCGHLAPAGRRRPSAAVAGVGLSNPNTARQPTLEVGRKASQSGRQTWRRTTGRQPRVTAEPGHYGTVCSRFRAGQPTDRALSTAPLAPPEPGCYVPPQRVGEGLRGARDRSPVALVAPGRSPRRGRQPRVFHTVWSSLWIPQRTNPWRAGDRG